MKLITLFTFACHAIPNATSAFTPSTPLIIPSAFTQATHSTQFIFHNRHHNRPNRQLQESPTDLSDLPVALPADIPTPPDLPAPLLTVPEIEPSVIIPPIQLPPIKVPEIEPSVIMPPIQLPPINPIIDPSDLPAPPLSLPEIDYAVIALVAGQETYGFAIVALGEAIWSFSQAPSLSHAKVLVPAIIAGILLVGVSGPMVTNAADPASIRLGLEIATGCSVFLGASYVARLVSPFSPSAKEIAFLGLLVSIAGFFSFSQNLFVDGFVSLPTVNLPTVNLPSFDLPSLPKIELPSIGL